MCSLATTILFSVSICALCTSKVKDTAFVSWYNHLNNENLFCWSTVCCILFSCLPKSKQYAKKTMRCLHRALCTHTPGCLTECYKHVPTKWWYKGQLTVEFSLQQTKPVKRRQHKNRRISYLNATTGKRISWIYLDENIQPTQLLTHQICHTRLTDFQSFTETNCGLQKYGDNFQ
jgi:hypothetical protein